MKHRPVKTIADIAKLAGVSKSTVSRALNDSPLISDATKLRIQQIAQQHQFSVDHSARMLSLQQTQTLALVVPISAEHGYYISDPFMMKLIAAVADAAREANYDLLLTQAEVRDHAWIDRLVRGKRADGVVMLGCGLDMAAVERLVQAKANIVVWGEHSAELTYSSIVSDDVRGGELAAQHFLEIGRKNPAFIGGLRENSETANRLLGFERALQQADAPLPPERIADGDYSSRSGYEAMRKLLSADDQIDSVFVGSDVMAIGAMEALRESGKRIPEDVAVIGFDGIPLSAHCSPPLTTIEQNIGQVGKLMVEYLLRYMQDGIIMNAQVPVELVVRQSTVAG